MRPLFLLTLLATVPATAGAAQDAATRRLTLELGDARFFGGIHDSATPPVRIHPHRPTLVTVRYAAGHFGVGLTVAGAATEYRGEGLSILVPGDVALVEVAPEARLPLLRGAPGTELTAHAGPLFSFWKAEGYPATMQIGVQLGGSLHLGLGGRFGVNLRLDGGVGGAEVAADALDPGLSRGPLWRTRVAIGLSYQISPIG